MTDTDTTDDVVRDPAQLVPPHLDSRLKLWIIPLAELRYFVPMGVGLVGAVFALLLGSRWALPFGAGAIVTGVLALALVLRAHEYTTPGDLIRNVRLSVAIPRAFPLTHEQAAEETVHGVERIDTNGYAELVDGSLAGLVRVHGRNVDLRTAATANQLSASLADGVDEDVRDFSFRFHSTTVDPDLEPIIETYEEQAFSGRFGGEEWASVRALCHDIVRWTEERDAPRWQANEWRHYIVVSVGPGEVDPDPHEQAQKTRGRRLYEHVVGESEDADARLQRQRAMLDQRLTEIKRDVIGHLDGCEAEHVGAGELAALLARYWTGTAHHLEERATLPAQLTDALSPDHYDISNGHVTVGQQYCRTFWIAGWPAEPDPGFLQELYTMRGADLDVTIRVEACDKRATMDELEHQIAEVDASALERQEDTDLSEYAAGDTLESLVLMHELLRRTNSQPWDVAGYVTVRTGPRATLEAAAAAADDGEALTLDAARYRALEEAAEDVRSVLEGSPAELLVFETPARQGQLFASAAPVGPDEYDTGSHYNRYTRTLGGTVGAMFPFGSIDVDESNGVEYGRQMQTGTILRADAFDRGGAGHQLTIAKSGSGKTYAVGRRALRWWVSQADRTLVLCDTMGGFAGLTELVNGEHIVVDGTRTINPLDIQPAPAAVLERSDIDPYRMKLDEAREFLTGVIRGQGVDPGPFVATIEDALDATYARAEIYPDDVDSHANESPTMADFIDTLSDMLDNPTAYTHTDHEKEIAEKTSQVSRLLDKLSGFSETGKYRHLVGQSDVSIQPGGVTYLDLRQIEGQGAAEKSTLLQLMLGQVYQTVKQAPEKALFVIDEAHYLLHSPDMVEWLQQAARHWRHYDAAIHFVSQSPAEFVATVGDESADHRETITGQCSTIEFFRTPGLSASVAEKFGMNEHHYQFVKTGATPGDAGVGYSQSLISFSDVDGWIRTQVAASPLEDAVLTYDPDDDGPFGAYLSYHLPDGERFSRGENE